MSELYSQLNIAGIDFVLTTEDCLKVFALISKGKILRRYDEDVILREVDMYNVQMNPLPNDFMDIVAAANAVGATYGDFTKK